MDTNYLYGYLSVHFGTNDVELAHRVNGRLSYMDLDQGDLIEVKEDNQYKRITVIDVLKAIVGEDSINHSQLEHGQSFYQGTEVRVLLNRYSTKKIDRENENRAIKDLFRAVKDGFISYEDAIDTMEKWETIFKES